MIKVVKFGGSSVASAEQFKKIKNIIDSDDSRRIVVVSALGKRFSKDNKITDLLYLLSEHIRYGVDYSNIFSLIANRYEEIRTELDLPIDITKEFDKIKENIKAGTDQQYIVSRGEYLCGKLMAAYLGYTFVDAQDVVFFNYDGSVDEEKTAEAVRTAFAKYNKIVVPGFYGAFPTGEVKLFSRGGSDITGSIMAMAVNAKIYENWTDVSGLLMADPRIVKDPIGVEEITYDELRELSYMGASVLHEETISPIRELDIPINILNTNRPQDKGTLILKESTKTDNIITGIAGKKNYKAITVFKEINADKMGVLKGALDVFSKFNVSVEYMTSAIDSFVLVAEAKALDKSMFDIISELKKIKGVSKLDVDNDLALIAVVGRNMALKPGISGKIFSIFGEEGINIKTISQGPQEINIMVGVGNADFEKAINTVYSSFLNIK